MLEDLLSEVDLELDSRGAVVIELPEGVDMSDLRSAVKRVAGRQGRYRTRVLPSGDLLVWLVDDWPDGLNIEDIED